LCVIQKHQEYALHIYIYIYIYMTLET